MKGNLRVARKLGLGFFKFKNSFFNLKKLQNNLETHINPLMLSNNPKIGS
jgi:hypothetical protein